MSHTHTHIYKLIQLHFVSIKTKLVQLLLMTTTSKTYHQNLDSSYQNLLGKSRFMEIVIRYRSCRPKKTASLYLKLNVDSYEYIPTLIYLLTSSCVSGAESQNSVYSTIHKTSFVSERVVFNLHSTSIYL